MKPLAIQTLTGIKREPLSIEMESILRILGNEPRSVKPVHPWTAQAHYWSILRWKICQLQFFLPSGGVVIDTPGMRELGIESVDLSKTFAEIDELSIKCKFHDCSHTSEPNCAVQLAIKVGLLSKDRLANYLKLKKEAKYEGLNSKQIETEKLTAMFAEAGGMKNVRKFIKEKNNRRHPRALL